MINQPANVQHRMTLNNLAGVLILAGGLSTRMGSPKALLKLPSGERLIDYHVRHATKLGVPVVIADNGQGFKPSIGDSGSDHNASSSGSGSIKNGQISHVLDYQPHSSQPHAQDKHSAGPLGAILAGMQQLLAMQANVVSGDVDNALKWLVVVSCDSLVNARDIWQYLTSQQSQRALSPAASIADNDIAPDIYCLNDNERDYPLLALYSLSVADSLKAYLDSGERRVMRFINPISQSITMPEAWYTLSNLNTPEHFQSACEHLNAGAKSMSDKHNTQPALSSKQLSHLDADGDIHMVDVGHKTVTTREAVAQGYVVFPADIYQQIKNADGLTKKGSITQTAHIAGIMAAKRTHDLIPLCHPLPLDKIGLSFEYDDAHSAIRVEGKVRVTHKTGVEMEALTAVSVACLTIYDMTKALSHDIIMNDIRLVTKTGGKSDYQA